MATACYVTAPITAFRAPQAREYLETLPVPPPATVYGMLCSLVGEPDRFVHAGAEVAIGVIASGTQTRVLRTLWRVKDANTELGLRENKRPDFQVLLTGVAFAVHVRPGEDKGTPTLAERLSIAFDDPATVTRFGGLALGESTHLVDEVRRLRPDDRAPLEWLMGAPDGQLPLPVWADHVGSAGTRYGQFQLVPGDDPASPPDAAWVGIAPALQL
jgi:CRISPR-associated protein Cas5t